MKGKQIQNTSLFSCIETNMDNFCLNISREQTVNEEYFINSHIEFTAIFCFKLLASIAAVLVVYGVCPIAFWFNETYTQSQAVCIIY